MKEYILGIHFGHDATAVLLEEDKVSKLVKIIEAMSEERLSRQKKHAGFPHLSLKYIKEKYNISDFEKVFVVGDIPGRYGYIFENIESNKKWRENKSIDNWLFLKALANYFKIFGFIVDLRNRFLLFKIRLGLQEKVFNYLKLQFPKANLDLNFNFVNHHLSHAWAGLAFMDKEKRKEKFLFLTLDGEGDNSSGSINIYDPMTEKKIEVVSKMLFKDSLGLLYSAVTDFLGMKRNEHEFKVMGLAPYAKESAGEKVYEEFKKIIYLDKENLQIKSLIDVRKATAWLVMNNFSGYRFDSIAYGIQKITEELIIKLTQAAIKKYKIRNICVGGGVFMNIKVNQKLRDLSEVDYFLATPSCGDESLAIGAVLYGYNGLHKNLDNFLPITDLYLGSQEKDSQIKFAIDEFLAKEENKNKYEVLYFDQNKGEIIEKKVAELLANNCVVARFKNRSEWGARALGNRSILANPSSRDNVKLINEMIKNRDFWMPFAVSLLSNKQEDYLINPENYFAPYMSMTFETKEKAHKELIAALHPYDLTSRPQMVSPEYNPEYYALIKHFSELTGISGVLNTSFNLHGQPNVEKTTEALQTLKDSGLKYLAIGNYLITKI